MWKLLGDGGDSFTKLCLSVCRWKLILATNTLRHVPLLAARRVVVVAGDGHLEIWLSGW